MNYSRILCLVLGFIAGGCLTAFASLIYLKNRRTKNQLPSDFQLSDYSSQQLAKLFGDRILNLFREKFQLRPASEKTPIQFQSQWCEDILLFDFFDHKKSGYYIEIGAFDGVRLSNTYFFESIGWTGILVEPQPVQFEKCNANRPNSKCHNVAIGSGKEDVQLNVVRDQHYETWSFVGDKEKAEKETGFKFESVTVKCKTINELIPADVKKIDFISIDVEGMEQEILTTIDLDKYDPEIILLENSTPPIQEYLAKFGYKLAYRTWINYFYCKNPEKFKNISLWNDVDIRILG